jgi:DNA-binding transcriptional LysR family regulator
MGMSAPHQDFIAPESIYADLGVGRSARHGLMGNRMHWDDLLAFRAVAMELSFTKAARKLNLSTSVVSQRVARLERRLGETLLTRTTRKSVLTSTGYLVLMLVSQMNNHWNRIATLAGDSPVSSPGRLLELGLPVWMPDSAMRMLSTVLPQGRAIISVAGSETNLARLANREVDFVLAGEFDFSPHSAPPNAYLRTVSRVPLCIGVPRTHPLAARNRISLEDLSGEQVMLDATESKAIQSLAENLRVKGRCRVLKSDPDVENDPHVNEVPRSPHGATKRAIHHDMVKIPMTDDTLGYHIFTAWNPATVDETIAADLHWLASEHRNRCIDLLKSTPIPGMRLMGER